MPHDYHSRASTPEWLANYDRNFPPSGQGKRAATLKEEASETAKAIRFRVEVAQARIRAAFPFCPYLRDE